MTLLSNQALYDIAVAKQLYAEQLKLGYRARAEEALEVFLKSVLSDIAEKVRAEGFSQMSPGTLRLLRAHFLATELKHREPFKRELEKLLRDFVVAEAELQRFIAKAATGEEPEEQDPEEVWRQARQAFIGEQGDSLNAFMTLVLAGLAVTGRRALQSSFVSAESATDTAKRLRGLEKPYRRSIGVLIDTAIQSLAGSVFALVWGERAPKYIWISVLDSSTTAICRSRSRKVYVFGKGPRPPAHVGCRSTTSAFYPGRGNVLQETLAQWLSRQRAKDLSVNRPITAAQYAQKVRKYVEDQAN